MIITSVTDALIELKTLCSPSTDPVLDDTDLTPILARCVRATIWTASTSYTFGAVIIPTAAKRNGHRYRLVAFDGVDVKSGATEPAWRMFDQSRVNDGNITWREDGIDYDSLWDIQYAAYLAWDLKCQRASEKYSVSSGGQNFQRGTQYDNLVRQRDRFRPIRIA